MPADPNPIACRVPQAVARAAKIRASQEGVTLSAWMARLIKAELSRDVHETVNDNSPPAFILPARDHAKRAADNTAYARHIEETGSRRLSGRMHSEPRALKPTHAKTAQRKPAFKD